MYKVFLSSTSRDLADYREAVHRAIDGLPGFQLVKMEDFGARDATAKDLCSRLVRECNLFVGLMGHCYGSCPPNDTVSFTELEYRTAKDAGLPRLMFAAPDDFAIPASLHESDASFERQQALRREVMNERVVASFATPEQLASAVTKALFVWHEEQRRAAQPTALTETKEARPVAAPEAERPLGPNPYRGLEAFRKEDADRFFGREALVDQLWTRFLELHASRANGETPLRLLAILGASGSGKSSVAQAGLLAELEKRPLPGRPAPTTVVFTPEARPLESLAVALAREAASEASPTKTAIEFEEVLRSRDDHDGLRYLAERVLDVGGTGLILLVDQFEELYSLCDDAKERDAFIGNLLLAAREPRGPVSIILTLRSDFLGAVNQHPELSRLIARQNILVAVMGQEELRRAIEEPARRAGREIDRSTVDLLIEQTVGREGALPALEFVLTRIWEGFRQGASPADTVRGLGGVGGALAKEAERLYDGLSDDHKAVARRAFLAMTMLGEGTKDTRRRAPIDEMVPAGQPESDVRRVLEIFADPDRRLVTLAADKDGRTIAEVAHEALFDHWSELRRWLDQDRDKIRFARRLESAVKEWIDAGRPKGMLWRPPLLDLLRGYARDKAGDMPAGQLAFLEASESQHRRGIRTRRAGIAAEIVGLLIIAGGLTIYSRQQAELAKRETEFAQRQAELRQQADEARFGAIGQAELAEQEKQRADAERDKALTERNKALQNQSLLLARIAQQEIERGNATNGILLALEALPRDMGEPDRPHVVEAEAALYRAVSEHRELAVLRNIGGARSAAFSPDGTRLVTASNDETARVWDAASGQPLVTLKGHEHGVNSAAFSPDGRRVVTTSGDDTARLWDAASGQPLVTLEGHTGPVNSVAFSPDGTRVVTASDDATAGVWDAASGHELLTLEGHTSHWVELAEVELFGLVIGGLQLRYNTGRVNSAAFSPDGTRVVTASHDETARLWDAASGKALATLEGHTGPVNSVAFSPDGRRVVTASLDNTARLWNAASGKALVTLEGHEDEVSSAAFSPDGTRVVTASGDKTARLWDAASGQPLVTLEGHTAPVNSAAFSRDGTRVVTVSDDGTARLWDATFGTLGGHEGEVNSAAFSPDGRRVVTASGDKTARLWDATSGQPLVTLEGYTDPVKLQDNPLANSLAEMASRWGIKLELHAEGVNAAAFSPDGRRVVTASNNATARLWDAASGRGLLTLEGHTGSLSWAAFSPDGSRVVTASGDRTARLWNAASGQELRTLEGHTDSVNAAAFSSDGRRVVTASDDDTARLWDAATGQVLVTLEGHTGQVNAAAFSPDGARVVTASDDATARLWDAATGQVLVILEGHTSEVTFTSAAFSSDSRLVVTASNHATAQLWDAATGQMLVTLEGHSGQVNSAAFNPDGTRLVTASSDRTARLWDAASGIVEANRGGVTSRALSPDSMRVVEGSDAATAKLWRVFRTTQELIDYARSIVPRQLTPEQRRQFFLE